MLVLHRKEQRWKDRMFRELPEFLGAGDCLVLNDSKVFPSRLFGHRAGMSGEVEVLLLQPSPEGTRVSVARDVGQIQALVEAGISLDEAVMPATSPPDGQGMALTGT